jgi:adenylate kinase family enzyme
LQKAQTLHPRYADQIISLKRIVMQSRRTLKHLIEEKYRSGEALVKKLVETDTHRGVKFSDTHPEVAKMIGYE